MQEELGLHFVAFNFLSCYHRENMFYQWSSTQAVFQEGIQLFESKDLYQEKSSVMELLQWNGHIKEQDYQPERILVQILKCTPLIFEKGQQPSAILHEIAIVPWVCEAVESIGVFFTRIFKLRRLHLRRIFVVLSKVIDDKWMHCFKNGHLGCLLNQEKWEMTLKNSDYLEKDLQKKLEWDVLVRTGTTEQKAIANCDQISKANKLSTFVYDQIDISFVTIYDISAGCSLLDTKLISTQNLDPVFEFTNEEDTDEEYYL